MSQMLNDQFINFLDQTVKSAIAADNDVPHKRLGEFLSPIVDFIKKTDDQKIQKYLDDLEIPSSLGCDSQDFIKVVNGTGNFIVKLHPKKNEYFKIIMKQNEITRTLCKLIYDEFNKSCNVKIIKPNV